MAGGNGMKSIYDPVLKRIPEREGCPEIVFRQAGDGFIEVVYGNNEASANKTIKDIILRTLRVIIINDKIKKCSIEGLIETVPGGESLLYMFDPLKIEVSKLIEIITEIELSLPDVYGQKVDARVLHLPIVFDHSLIKKAVNKYVKEINPEAFYCKDGSNLEYVAQYNGITVEDLKKRFLGTQYLTAMVGFFPGLPFCYPTNPASALTSPKYNPARTWTPEGAVDLADYCMTIFGVESSGGCPLIGRTVPIFRSEPVHKMFESSPALIRPTDLIEYYEISEEELDKIYEMVDAGEWEYKTENTVFSVDEWLEFYEAHESEMKELQEKQAEAQKTIKRV